ncbi:glycerophosphodiester phosphodiesterase [Streptomyces durbertensis]|uniref:Glycerophosphodiester phosphodiesterase n=1 Tax=Streptomyces durbertensis TaxID=2448886 RepID=A0ABR6EKH3_9ACTN|nr:glycerophosphodiester phosphodiesterase family protein [Streptomyces durbertensis]MBB1245816.1 glycerophosphodiester phosphodiesterase [Streptomyces durbertensis]
MALVLTIGPAQPLQQVTAEPSAPPTRPTTEEDAARPAERATGTVAERASAVPLPTNAAPDERLPRGAVGVGVVAHRGASAYAPENTLAAADKADELGIDWVENDVQRTRDGELVVMHDETLARTTDVEEVFPDRAPWKVSDFTAEEIAQLDAGSWFSPEYAGEKVPTFSEFLARMTENGQKLLLELKKPELYPGIERDVLRELRNQGWLNYSKRRDLVVQSFNADSVRTVHQQAPRVRTGFLGTPPVSRLRDYARFSDQINPRHTTVTREYVDAVHRLRGPQGQRLEVFTWTVDDAATARRLVDMGVDGIISNRPDVIRDAVGGRAGD